MMREFTVAELLGRSFALLRTGAIPALATMVTLAAAGTAIDIGLFAGPSFYAANILLVAAPAAAQYWLGRAALREIGSGFRPHRGLAVYFGFLIISGAAIMLGFLFLIIPGLILTVRWWIAGAILLDSETSLNDAFGNSWRETSGHFWPIFGALAVIWIPIAMAIIAAASNISLDADPLPLSVVTNLGTYAGFVLSWYSAIAAYSFSTGRNDTLTEVFA